MSSLIIIIANHPEKKDKGGRGGGRKVELHGGFSLLGGEGGSYVVCLVGGGR